MGDVQAGRLGQGVEGRESGVLLPLPSVYADDPGREAAQLPLRCVDASHRLFLSRWCCSCLLGANGDRLRVPSSGVAERARLRRSLTTRSSTPICPRFFRAFFGSPRSSRKASFACRSGPFGAVRRSVCAERSGPPCPQVWDRSLRRERWRRASPRSARARRRSAGREPGLVCCERDDHPLARPRRGRASTTRARTTPGSTRPGSAAALARPAASPHEFAITAPRADDPPLRVADWRVAGRRSLRAGRRTRHRVAGITPCRARDQSLQVAPDPYFGARGAGSGHPLVPCTRAG